MNKILILFAHPKFEKSRAHQALVKHIPRDPNITFHDLYEKYPDFNIDIAYEQKLVAEHQIIVWQHPFYWYSAPALMKQWIDMVLDFGWAYGPGGDKLKDKLIFNALSSGGPRHVYSEEGHNRFTVNQFLYPFDQTARLCKMIYLPPFAMQGAYKRTPEDMDAFAKFYGIVLHKMIYNEFNVDEISKYHFMDEWIQDKLKD